MRKLYTVLILFALVAPYFVPNVVFPSAYTHDYYTETFSTTSTPNKPIDYHTFTNISNQGTSIELEDGSVWIVRAKDRQIAHNWNKNAPLQIVTNGLLYNVFQSEKCEYRIKNLERNESVAVTLTLGPHCKNPNLLKISAINYSTGDILLSSGHTLHVSPTPKNRYNLQRWQRSDVVLIGENDHWISKHYYPLIIINYSANDFVIASFR